MLAVEFKADTTLPLKLNPVAFKLPPVTFATALNPTFDVNVFAELLYRNVTNGLP